jgi:hypothetical protein
MKAGRIVALLIFACTGAQAQGTEAPPLPFDSPVSMRAMEAVCTGIGADARIDPRWPSYPLRIELVGRAGVFLGQASVTLTQNDEAIISVRSGVTKPAAMARPASRSSLEITMSTSPTPGVSASTGRPLAGLGA